MKNRQKPGRMRTPSVQQLAGAPGPTVEGLGGVWRLGFNDQNAKGALEELVRAHFVRRELPLKRALPAAEGERYWRDEVRPLLDSGYYDTFGAGWVATLRSPEGVLLFLQSLLLKHHPGVTFAEARDLFAAEPEQVMAAVEVVAPDFFGRAAVEMGYGTEDAEKGGAAVADALRTQFAAARESLRPNPTPTPTPPGPVTGSTTAAT